MSGAYDSATALLVVDVQNDFADPAGGLYVQGGEEIMDAVNVEIAAAIGNAVFDATGARLRQVPYTPDRVKAALQNRT